MLMSATCSNAFAQSSSEPETQLIKRGQPAPGDGRWFSESAFITIWQSIHQFENNEIAYRNHIALKDARLEALALRLGEAQKKADVAEVMARNHEAHAKMAQDLANERISVTTYIITSAACIVIGVIVGGLAF